MSVPKMMLPLRLLFDALSDGVLVTDGAGYRTYSNPALNAMVGGDARLPVQSLDPPTFLPDDQHDRYHRYLEMISSGAFDDEVLSLDWEIIDAEENRTPVAMKLLPVRNGSRGPAAVFWLVLDVSGSTNGSTDKRRRDLEEGLYKIAGELQKLGVAGSSAPAADRPEFEQLSRREREVIELLLSGHRVVTIADELCLSAHTVRNHLKSIFRKLSVHSQAELVDLFRGRTR
ncbi:MAG: PAS and helix-turn-helix domain-containing protein [Acidimicrobiia bacterium]|nr:PAS and helix-turn-helix domain-containing protein [Acidimicrobiia bacterium]NNF68599.1 PAS and helix-turn-helix domain-containing protein [Acidimicrobiia bacterium]